MEEHFNKIITELKRQSLPNNRHRLSAGVGRTQTFGVVNRRCCSSDYSTISIKRPYLYKLLLDFGEQFIDIEFNAITINQNYRCGIHRDSNNVGESVLVAFGDYTGGELEIHEGEKKGVHSVKHSLFRENFGENYHSVLPFDGERYSLVFYKAPCERIPPPSVKFEKGKWNFYRGDILTTGLPHPLRKPRG